MTKQKIIISSFLKSFGDIWKNKSMFLLLFILQVLFLYALFSTSVKYQTRILNDTQAISDYLSRQNLDEFSIAQNVMQQKEILGEDPLIISRHFSSIARNFRIYLAVMFMLFAVFLSLAWSLSCSLTRKIGFSQLKRLFARNLAAAMVCLALIFLFFYSLFSIPVGQADDTGIFAKYVPFLAAAPILAYFMLVSLSLPPAVSLREALQKTLGIGIKKAHYVLSAFFICIILTAVPIALLYYFFEQSLAILVFALAAMVFSLVFGRIFMANVAEKLADL